MRDFARLTDTKYERARQVIGLLAIVLVLGGTLFAAVTGAEAVIDTRAKAKELREDIIQVCNRRINETRANRDRALAEENYKRIVVQDKTGVSAVVREAARIDAEVQHRSAAKYEANLPKAFRETEEGMEYPEFTCEKSF